VVRFTFCCDQLVLTNWLEVIFSPTGIDCFVIERGRNPSRGTADADSTFRREAIDENRRDDETTPRFSTRSHALKSLSGRPYKPFYWKSLSSFFVVVVFTFKI